jgi:hypothetical protein
MYLFTDKILFCHYSTRYTDKSLLKACREVQHISIKILTYHIKKYETNWIITCKLNWGKYFIVNSSDSRQLFKKVFISIL